MMGQFQPLERQTFGRLAVVSLSPARVGQKGAFWLCRCQCGAEKPVRAAALRSGNTKSCGCLKLDRMTKHGAHRTAEYQIWRGMKDRCGRPKRARYESYGGKGVRVCERWRDSFENFLADMGPRPGPAYSIERDDNDATMSRGIADGRLPPNNPGTRPCSGIMPAELPESHGQNEKENGARLLASRAEISGSVITTAWPRLQRPGRMLR